MKIPATEPATNPRTRVALFRLFAVLLAVFIASGLCEVALRIFMRKQLEIPGDERNLLFHHDPSLGWFPVPNSRAKFIASRMIHVANNSQGFRAPEHRLSSRPGIAFVGDSFVWGYDVEASERFTEKLQERHPEWNIFNLGVSGYGTDQEYLLLQSLFDAYKPRIVFLIFCTETDDDDNRTNMRYGGYYKPYCTIVNNRLMLNGIPVPRGERAWLAEHKIASESYLVRLLVRGWFKNAAPPELHNPNPTGPIIRDMQKFVAGKGATLLVGLTKANPRLEEFLTFFKIPFLNLDTNLRYPEFGTHWTPEGHTFVCDKIDKFLLDGKFLEQMPQPQGRQEDLSTNGTTEK
jgi:hypothetical protein